MFQANCNPILIGSLPLDDYNKAMELILKHTPQIPLWPQLPSKPKEGMVRQFMTGYPGLIDQTNKSFIDTSIAGFEEEMTSFYEEYFLCVNDKVTLSDSRFALGLDSAAGFFTFIDAVRHHTGYLSLKGQITGPVTTGIGINSQEGTPILYDDNLRDMLIKHLCLKARWQINEMKKVATRATVPIIFIDEPGIVSFGSTGFAGVTRKMVSESVDEVIKAIKQGGGIAGIHICANGDWEPVLTSEAQIISFDGYFFFENFILYKEHLTTYLERGGNLAWGIVPTGDPFIVEKEDSLSIFKKWKDQLHTLSQFGLNKNRLMQQTLIAPSCGTGSLSPKLAQKVLKMTMEVSVMAQTYMKETT